MSFSSARLADRDYLDENERLFTNLNMQGYIDTRPRQSTLEVRTYFKEGRRHFQLDHVFTDHETESNVESWRVLNRNQPSRSA